MDAGKRTVNDIFNGTRILEIPFFQRSYVWGEDQWERFLDDMMLISDQKKPYFLGSVILKQKPTGTAAISGDVRTLIDGQQRLTTIALFFKVLSLSANEDYYFNKMFYVRPGVLAISHNHNDIKAFEEILKLEDLKDLDGGDNITKAYMFFKKNVDVKRLQEDAIRENVMFVGIDLIGDEDEQQIFDTNNSLGVKLTSSELLKNHLFGRDEIKMYEDYWKEVFEKDLDAKKYWDDEVLAGSRNRSFIDIFFYAFLQIKMQEPVLKVEADDKKNFSRIDSLFESYKVLIKKYKLDKHDFLEEVREYARLFNDNFNLDVVGCELTGASWVDRMNVLIFGLGNSTLIPYVLYLLKGVDESERDKIFAFIEGYVMRRIVVKATSKNYTQLFTEEFISKRALTLARVRDLISGKTPGQVNSMPNDSELKHAFHEAVLVNKRALGVLYMLESRLRDKSKQSTSLMGLNRYSLEHIMPKKWRNEWPPPSGVNSEDRDRKLKTLGNLTIITQSLNASVRDSEWSKKISGVSDNGLKYYSAGIETISSFLDSPSWSEDDISKRANYLFEKAKALWPKEPLDA